MKQDTLNGMKRVNANAELSKLHLQKKLVDKRVQKCTEIDG